MSQSFSKQTLCTYASSILASKEDLLFPAMQTTKRTHTSTIHGNVLTCIHISKNGRNFHSSVASTLAGPERAGLTHCTHCFGGNTYRTYRKKPTDCLGLGASILVVLLVVVVVVAVVAVVVVVVAAAVVSVADFVVLRMYTRSIHLYVSM